MTSFRFPLLSVVLLVIASCGSDSNTTSTPPPHGLLPLHTDGRFIKDSTGKTVILRGVAVADLKEVDTMRAPMKLATLLDLVGDASQGWYARVVRLTVYPPDYLPDPDGYFTNYLKPAVDHATARGLYAIVDWHEIGDAAPADQETRQFWAKAAPAFASYPNVLYEVFNESEDLNDTSWATWKANAQPWVDQIRGDAPDNIILIGAPFWTQDIDGAVSEPFVGSNLAYVGHIYPGISPSVWGPGGAFTQVAAVRPMMITEWGYRDGGTDPTNGTEASFGDALKAWIEAQRVGWTAWCADTIWDSTMFNAADWSLRVGPGEMGGFTKDWLAAKKDADQPSGGGGSGGSGGSGGAGGGASGSGGTGGSVGTGGGAGTIITGGDGGIDCSTYADSNSCAADPGCYWHDADCAHPAAFCALEGGGVTLCP
jgi:endoglucanase